MSAIALLREALDELRRTQFRDETKILAYEVMTVIICTGCENEVRIPGSVMKGDGAHLCARTRLHADIEAAIREGKP